jgi:HptB-dependent secretion and biofilm anti anti-sigma factor
MSISFHLNEKHSIISIGDRFTFSDCSDFRKALQQAAENAAQSMAIQLRDVHFMDSSGLGMLLVALAECQKYGITLTLNHPQPEINALLEITRSNEKFTIIH